jgi:hypothetical protein
MATAHIRDIFSMRHSTSTLSEDEFEIMDSNEAHYVTCIKLYPDSDSESNNDSESTFDDESLLNMGFYYTHDNPMVKWLGECSKKAKALQRLNYKMYREKNKKKRSKQLEHVTNLLNDLKQTMNI